MVCFETLGSKSFHEIFTTLKELQSRTMNATLSGLRPQKIECAVPRVAKAQPWAEISERFQR